nr:hypothetical protein [Mycoplasmopsis bovis]
MKHNRKSNDEMNKNKRIWQEPKETNNKKRKKLIENKVIRWEQFDKILDTS